MAYTYHTVASAARELMILERVLADERRKLKAAYANPGRHYGVGYKQIQKTIYNMERRRMMLHGELEKAKENERHGIPPLGPETTQEAMARQ